MAMAADKNQPGQDTPFGVLEFLHWNHSWNAYKYPSAKAIGKAAALMEQAGVSWVRQDFLWDEIEPQPGNFQFEKYDQIVAILEKHHLRILGLLDYSASWAAKDGQWNSPPNDTQQFANFAATVIARYKGRITHWEVWNEPDSSTYWQPQDGLVGYCQLLKDVYLAAKKANPDCTILNGGLANGISSLNNLYDRGGKGYFDVLNLHFFATPFSTQSQPALLGFAKTAYKIMQRNGDGAKKIWFTEIGCPGVAAGSGEVANWWLGKNPSQAQQAQWLTQVYTALLNDPHVEKIFWAFFRDCDNHWSNGVDYFGIVRQDFSKKPAFGAYRKCVAQWSKGK